MDLENSSASFYRLFLTFLLHLKSDNKNKGFLKNFKLVLHGTYDKPDYLKNGPRKYEDESEKRSLDDGEENNSAAAYEQSTDSEEVESLLKRLFGARNLDESDSQEDSQM